MPIYTYRCENCGVQFDRQQKFSDAPLTRCPECSKKTLRKVFQPVGIVFKGSGFYSTDHRSPSGAGNRSSKESKSGDGESKSSLNEKSSSSEKSGSSEKPTSSSSSAE
jgi:putative FmdB family regulatory protein